MPEAHPFQPYTNFLDLSFQQLSDLEERFADAEQQPDQTCRVLLLAGTLAKLEGQYAIYSSSALLRSRLLHYNFEERFVNCQRRLQALREFAVTQMLDDSSQPSPHQQLSSLGITTRRDAKAFMRAAICEDSKSAAASFDALWKELEATPEDELATKVFTPQTVDQAFKNEMLQQVHTIYCKAYQRELGAEQQLLLIKANREHKLVEHIYEVGNKRILLAKHVEKRIQDCRKINAARLMYDRFVAGFAALRQSIDACMRVVSLVNVDELEKQYQDLMELYREGSKVSLLSHLDPLGDNGRALDSLNLNRNAGEEDRSSQKRGTDLALDVQELNEYIRDLEGCNDAFVAQCDVVAKYQNEARRLDERIDKLSRDDTLVEISSELWSTTSFWNAIIDEFNSAHVVRRSELSQLIWEISRMQMQYDSRELVLCTEARSMQLPHVLSLEQNPESKDEKDEKDFKAGQECERVILDAPIARLSPVDFVKRLMPSQQVIEECAKAADRNSDQSLSERARHLALQYHTDFHNHRVSYLPLEIEALRQRNVELLSLMQKRKPRKPSPKKWIRMAVEYFIVIIVGVCLIGVLSNPIGWSIGAQIGALVGLCLCVREVYLSAKKAYALYKRNKLLEKNNKPDYIQALLEDQDDALQKKSNCLQTHTTAKVREMLIEHSILVNSVNKDKQLSLVDAQPSNFVMAPRRRAALENCSLLRDTKDAYKNTKLFSISYFKDESAMSYERSPVSGSELVPADHDQFEAALQPIPRQIASPAA